MPLDFNHIGGLQVAKRFDMKQALDDRRYGDAIAFLMQRIDLMQKALSKCLSKSKSNSVSKSDTKSSDK